MAVAGGASSSVLVSSAKETAALKVNPADVPALEIKLGALAVLLSVTLLFGFAPLCIVRGAGRFSVQPDLRRLLLSLISCFAGGVFFATCLLDLLPDYLQSINEAFSSAGIKLQFPLPEFIVAMGFFLVLVLEQIILAFKDQTSPSPEERRSLLVDSSIQSNDHRRRGSRLRMKVLNICTPEDHNGLDYMAAFFHRWLQEPGRVVFIARIDGRVVALESALLVDGGQTAILQGRRVVSDLRGSGIASAIQTHVTNYVRRYYPEVSAVRLSRGDNPSAQTLAKYRLIAKEAILSLCCEAVDLGAFIAELRSKHPLHADSSCGPVTLSRRQAETLVLSDHVVSNLLPGRTVINDWEPLKPVEANLEVLRRRGLTWIVDREFEPAALSLSTPPYAVPYRHNAMCLNINIFGRSLASVCAVFLAQLEAFLPSLKGYLVCHTYVDPALWAGFRQFCQNGANVSFFKDYWEEVILETDL